jgi:antirestriction protein ArdC
LIDGDDAGHFDGNFDIVIVSDFESFASARDYVAHPLHQAYVRDHASHVVGERVVVQHDWEP